MKIAGGFPALFHFNLAGFGDCDHHAYCLSCYQGT